VSGYYNSVLACIRDAVVANISMTKSTVDNLHNVPDWNHYVHEKHHEARVSYCDWLFDGKQRFGRLFCRMLSTCANFKLALRYCRAHENQLQADACTHHKDPIKFGKSVNKINSGKATKFAHSIGGITGASNLAIWKNHYQQLHNCTFSSEDIAIRDYVQSMSCDKLNIDLQSVVCAISKQKTGKASGPGGIPSEAYMHGGSKLVVHLCILFNLFSCHSFLPADFMACSLLFLLLLNVRLVTLVTLTTIELLHCLMQ